MYNILLILYFFLFYMFNHHLVSRKDCKRFFVMPSLNLIMRKKHNNKFITIYYLFIHVLIIIYYDCFRCFQIIDILL